MIHLTIDAFEALGPCGYKERIEKVQDLFPVTDLMGVLKLSLMWRNRFEDDFEWLGCRIFDKKRRDRAVITSVVNATGSEYPDVYNLAANDGELLWRYYTVKLATIIGLLIAQEEDA